MVFCITLGKIEYKYKYILYSAISLLISDFAFWINYHGIFTGVGFVNFINAKDRNKFNQHYYIHQIFSILELLFYQKFYINAKLKQLNQLEIHL